MTLITSTTASTEGSLSVISQARMAVLTAFWVCVGAYGISVTGHFVLRLLFPTDHGIIALFNTFTHLLWIPALLFLPLAVVCRQWLLVACLVVPVSLFVSNYGQMFLPRASLTLADDVTTITLYTHNLLALNRTPDQIPDVITEVGADIVALQEVSIDLGERIATLDAYPYQAIHAQYDDGLNVRQRETMGQAILSRYPIIEDDYWVYDFLVKPLAHQRTVIDVHGQHIVVYNVHPTHPGMSDVFFDTRFRRMEFEDLLERIQAESLPVIMLGDFNLSDQNIEYGQIADHLTDAYQTVGRGMGYTFPDFSQASAIDSMEILPAFVSDMSLIPLLLRLDYVFHSEEFTALSAYVYHTSAGSDHRPLVVELALYAVPDR